MASPEIETLSTSAGRAGGVGLLEAISEFCRARMMAESTFGRHAVNDGKFVSRLRDGARITPETLARVTDYLAREGFSAPAEPRELRPLIRIAAPAPLQTSDEGRVRDFRFFDNRQKYLLFVNTCGEKAVIAQRVGLELANIHPEPPAVRIFDAGMGDGTVLSRVMRDMHRRFPTMPFHIVGKEISLEDVRLSLDRMADRLFEHPATVLVVTNMYYTEAPWLQPKSVQAAQSMIWHEVALSGSTAAAFDEQITALEPFLAKHWQARHGASGNPLYERPTALIIYREDFKFLLHDVIPKRGAVRADYDLVIASQPYRARASTRFKAERVIAPLARALRPGGRLLGIHSCGGDPGLEIVQRVWPGEAPFETNRHDLLRAVKSELGREARHYNFNAYADERAVFRYDMHTLPTEIADSGIGTSTLFAAWNAAVYVAQIEDARLDSAIGGRAYLDATRAVLNAHGSLWFNDESYIVSRKRDG
jgi:SAM-dependent methyltransferase